MTHLTPQLAMPCPRLELRWERNGESDPRWKCTYSLVWSLRQGDMRRPEEGPGEMRVELGSTLRHSDIDPVTDGEVSTPYRDGAHAKWDCESLGGHLPIVAICGDVATLVPLRPSQEN